MSKRVVAVSLVAAAGLCLGAGAVAQQFVYPAKGQSSDQQKKDEASCHTWAVSQSKYDPAQPATAATHSGRAYHCDRHGAGRRRERCCARGSGRRNRVR